MNNNTIVTIPSHAKKVFEGIIFDIYQWDQERFDGTTTTFEMGKRTDSVFVIGVVEDKVIVQHVEQPNNIKRFGLPGGMSEKNESAENAIKRELLEETGYTINHLELIETEQISTKLEWNIHTFIGSIQKIKEPVSDAGEKVKNTLTPFDEFIELVAKLKIKTSRNILYDAIHNPSKLKKFLEKFS